MKRIILALSLVVGSMGLLTGCTTGCATHQTVTAPVPGQTSDLDAQVYRGLRDIQAVLETYNGKVADGTFHPTPTMSDGMDQLKAAYNTTHRLWDTYHKASAAEQAATADALQSSSDTMHAKYTTALSDGAPIPPADTIGAKP